MEIERPDAIELLNQVQIAHRLSVGFYQRILPLVNQIASELSLLFWSWRPIHGDRPAQSGKSPSKKWAWDLVPMFASYHVFRNEQGERAKAGDMAAVFKIYLDNNIKPEKLAELKIKGEPDPLSMPTGSAVLELDLFWCVSDSRKSFESLWAEADWPSGKKEEWEFVLDNEGMSARRLTFALEDLMVTPEVIVESVRVEFAKAPRVQQ